MSARKTKLLLIYVGILSCKSLLSQEAIVINEYSKPALCGTKLIVAQDESKSLSIEKAVQLNYQKIKQDVPNFGFNNSSYWFKAIVVSDSKNEFKAAIQIANPNIDFVSITMFSKQLGTINKVYGDLQPFNSRENNNKYYLFDFNLMPFDTVNVLINVQNSGEQFHVPITFGNFNNYVEKESNEQLIFGLYFGFVFFGLLLNLFFYVGLKDQSSFLYIGYLLCLLFLQLSLTGLGFKYFWPNSIYIANHANPIFASISILFLLKFSQEFLNTSKYVPRLNKIINYLGVYMLLVAICAWFNNTNSYIFSVISINIISIVLIFIIVPTSVYILKQNFKPARFFLIAFIFLIISVFLFVLKNAGLLASNPITTYGLQMGSALQVLLLTLALIDKFNEFKKEALNRLQEVNELKTQANVELELKVEKRTKQINEQKSLLEEQKNEILSSIRYAKRIQNALLPADEILYQTFSNNCFVYYNPKDIVSGDFYWASLVKTSENESKKLSLAAVVDCTGHGVPGAFMSIVASNYLKQSLSESKVNNPAEALDFLNENIIRTLNQTSNQETQIRDGMDLAFIAIDYKAFKLSYAGANNALYIIRNTNLIELRPDKQAIGSINDEIKKYSLQQYELQKNDTVYLFTDGYADQFGGDKGKKLNYKRFKEILLSASMLPINIQKDFLHQKFESWKDNNEQTDDVCIMGIKME